MANYSSRYDYGVKTVIHRGKKVTTSVGTNLDYVISKLPETEEFKAGRIPIYHANRPDLISDTFYDTPEFWWYLMLFNNVSDPFEGLNVGDRILIPKL